jgi:phytoene desaturase
MASVVVVGAGLGGLAAAARLGALGHDVTVCEQADEVGGKLGVHRAGGFTFDTGPSLLTMPHVFTELFAATGTPLEEHLSLRPLDPIARYRFPDGTWLDASADLPRMCANLDAALGAGTGTGTEWRRFHERAGRIYEAVRGPFLSSALDGPLDLVRQAVRLRDLATIAPWLTLRGLAERHLHDPRARMLVDRYATYTGSDPRRAPAALACIPYVEQAFGAWYVEGGMHLLTAAVQERAERCGAQVRTGADVVALEPRAGPGWFVRLRDGEALHADLVVANADASHLYNDLLANSRAAANGLNDEARRMRARLRRRLARSTPSLSGFVLLLGLRGRTEDLAHHTVLFPTDYDAEFDALFGPSPRPVPDPTVYISVPDDPMIAPPGHEAWFVLVNAPRQGQVGRDGTPVDWDAPGLADRYAEHVLDLLATRGLAVRDRIVHRAVRTPADLARRTRAVGGAIYGTSSNGPRSAFLRPSNRSPVPGLYLVGGSAHPGGGLPLVTLSARIVAELIGPA